MTLDQWFPPHGPCALCGHPDARHRVFEAISSRYHAGDSLEDIAEDFDVVVEAVLAVLGRSPNDR